MSYQSMVDLPCNNSIRSDNGELIWIFIIIIFVIVMKTSSSQDQKNKIEFVLYFEVKNLDELGFAWIKKVNTSYLSVGGNLL